MATSVLAFTTTTFLLGGVGIHASGRKYDAAAQYRRWIKFLVYFLTVHCAVASAAVGPLCFGLLMIAIALVGAYELRRVYRGKPLTHRWVISFLLIGVLYSLLANMLIRFSLASTPAVLLFVYLVTASLDGFSQLTGQWIGRHRFVPKISPNKTFEGAMGGICAAVLTAWALRFWAELTPISSLLMGTSMAVAGIIGDLAASYVKRLGGVKDFGRILPEHGGVLDRFDSLLFTAATYFFLR